ncbi:HXXEE domain-containing protein [Candidatus Margulisiibacteriota bacterium]
MKYLRNHWFDFGLGFAIASIIYLSFNWSHHSMIQNLLWLNMIGLFLHQFEEYRFPGYFPKVINKLMYLSSKPDRYPLNSQSALIVNVCLGWVLYPLAAILGEKAFWLGMITIFISITNTIAHTLLLNIKGKTFYNPGMFSSIVLFLPVSILFIYFVISTHSAHMIDWIIGIVIGIPVSFFVMHIIVDRFKNIKTEYVFEE